MLPGCLQWRKANLPNGNPNSRRKPPRRNSSVVEKPWRAFTLRPAFMIFLATISAVLLGALETMRSISARDQGLVFLEDTSKISSGLYFAYNYCPIIVAVLYGILWSMLDLDVKRLEPYYQLSRPDGAPGRILFQDYAYNMSLVVPFRAMKAKEHGVWISALGSILITMGLVSLSGGLVGIGKVSVTETVDMDIWSNLVSTQVQASTFSGEYVNHAASISGAGASLPPFSTHNYTVAPFRPHSSDDTKNQTWTANTTVFWAQPTCRLLNKPRSVEVALNPQLTPTRRKKARLVDGETNPQLPPTRSEAGRLVVTLKDLTLTDRNCSINKSIVFPIQEVDKSGLKTTLLYSDWTRVNSTARGSQGSTVVKGDCPYVMHLASSVRARPANDTRGGNQTVPWAPVFRSDAITSTVYICTMEYFTAEGQVTVRGSDQTVTAVDTIHGRNRLDPNMFNVDRFEAQLAQPFFPFQQEQLDGNKTSQSTVYNTFDIANGRSLSSIAQQKLGYLDSSLKDGGLGQQLEQAYQLAFAVGFKSALDTSKLSKSHVGNRTHDTFTVAVIQPFVLASEAILSTATILCLALLFYYRRRYTVLRRDPDSLASMSALLADRSEDKTMCDPLVQGVEQSTTKQLKTTVSGVRYQLLTKALSNGRHRCILQSKGSKRIVRKSTHVDVTTKREGKPQEKEDSLPFLITAFGAFIAFLILASGIGILITLLVYSQQNNGFAFLASDDFRSKLLWSFLPTLVATTFSPSWTSLHRDLCVLEPFVNLQKGKSSASNSLSLPYAARSPVITFFHSLFRKHHLISLVAAMTISTNLLAVSLGSLFSKSYTTAESVVHFDRPYNPKVLTPFWDPRTFDLTDVFDLVRTNITENTPLAPFTSGNYSFMPLHIPDNPSISVDQFQGHTIGLGASLICDPFPIRLGTPGFKTRSGSTWVYFTTTTNPRNETQVPCRTSRARLLPLPASQQTQSIRFVMSDTGSLGYTKYGDPTGENHLFAPYAWVCAQSRTLLLEAGGPLAMTRNHSDDGILSFNLTASVCRPRIVVREFNITFNGKGQVSSYMETGEIVREQEFFLDGHLNFTGIYHSTFGLAAMDSCRDKSFSLNMQSIDGQKDARFDWPGLLTARARDAFPHVDDEATLVRTASQIYATVFSTFVSHYRDRLFDKSSSNETTPGLAFSREPRMVASIPMFSISLGLLLSYAVVGGVVLKTRRHRYASRLPKSLGSIIPYVCKSKMLADFRGTYTMSSKEREEYLTGLGKTYGFGWFIGTDGKLHQGIESEPLVRVQI